MTAKLDSYIVTLFGLDGLREHYMPGNRKRGTGVRAKRPFASEIDARTFVSERGWDRNEVYQCSICGEWHTASPARS